MIAVDVLRAAYDEVLAALRTEPTITHPPPRSTEVKASLFRRGVRASLAAVRDACRWARLPLADV